MSLASLCSWADRFESHLVENPEDRFSRDEDHNRPYKSENLGRQKQIATILKFEQYELQHDKTNKLSVHPAKTQISLGIRPVWSESSLSLSG